MVELLCSEYLIKISYHSHFVFLDFLSAAAGFVVFFEADGERLGYFFFGFAANLAVAGEETYFGVVRPGDFLATIFFSFFAGFSITIGFTSSTGVTSFSSSFTFSSSNS